MLIIKQNTTLCNLVLPLPVFILYYSYFTAILRSKGSSKEGEGAKIVVFLCVTEACHPAFQRTGSSMIAPGRVPGQSGSPSSSGCPPIPDVHVHRQTLAFMSSLGRGF